MNEPQNKIPLAKLIAELCPDGVEYKPIKAVYKRLKGTPITAGKMKEIENPEGEIRIFAGGKTVIDAKENDIPNANIIKTPAVLVQSRGIIDVIYYDKPFTFKNEMWAYTTEDEVAVKFLYYVLKNNIQKFRSAASVMGSMPQISLPVTEEFMVPVPPIEVQHKIVRILDKFTELILLLETERTARKKQYEYYLNVLVNGKISAWRRATLNEIADVRDGTHDSPKPSNSGYKLATSKNIIGGKIDLSTCYFISEKDYDEINLRSRVNQYDVLFSMIGTVGEVAVVMDEPCFAIKNMGLIRTNGNLLLAKFIFYWLQSDFSQKYIQSNLKGTAQKYLSLALLREFPIYLPDEKEMEQIVKQLDSFNTLVSDSKSGIPAEIAARKKQYEYYRDRLLTFREKGS